MIELALPTLAGRFFTTELSGKPLVNSVNTIYSKGCKLRFLMAKQETSWNKGVLVGQLAQWLVPVCRSGGTSTFQLLLHGKVGLELPSHIKRN